MKTLKTPKSKENKYLTNERLPFAACWAAWNAGKKCMVWETNKGKFISYDPLINICGLLLDKADHVIQNRTMVIRGYLLLLSIIWFYFDPRKTKKQGNIQIELSHGKIKMIGKIQLVVYYRCRVLFGWATTRL